jgi:hypothetical protein
MLFAPETQKPKTYHIIPLRRHDGGLASLADNTSEHASAALEPGQALALVVFDGTSVLLICGPQAAPAVTCRASSIGRRHTGAKRTLAGVPRKVDDLHDVEDPDLRDCVRSSLWPLLGLLKAL